MGVIKLRILGWEDYLKLSRWALCIHREPCKSLAGDQRDQQQHDIWVERETGKCYATNIIFEDGGNGHELKMLVASKS